MMTLYNLFDISTPKQWKTISKKLMDNKSKYPVYGANGIVGYYKDYNHIKETILIGCRGTCGKVNLSKPYSYINGNAMAIDNLNTNIVSTKYLYFFFKGYNFDKIVTGTAIPQITKAGLKSVNIPIPNLETQNKIVAVLDKASNLIKKKTRSIELLDDLIRSCFLDTFQADLLNFDKDGTKLKDIASVVSGITKGRKTKATEFIEVPYLRVANAQDGYFDLSEIKTIQATKKEIEKYTLHQYDILITEGGDPDKLGRGAIWEEEQSNYIYQNHLYRIRLNNFEDYSPYWLIQLIGSVFGKNYFLSQAKQTTGIATINKRQVNAFPIPDSSFENQKKFEQQYLIIQQRKNKLVQSLHEIETLFNSILQRAFNGQLNFNPNLELNALLDKIDLEAEDNDLSSIRNDITYLQLLIDRLNDQEFETIDLYNKAKYAVFELLKTEEGIEQVYDTSSKKIKLATK